MDLLLTGGTGFIGTPLVARLRADGHHCTILSRQARAEQDGLRYVRSLDEVASDESLDAVINLAGESLAAKRWTRTYRQRMEDSRLGTTEALLGLFRRLDSPPATLLSGSAVGFYGHQGDKELSENASAVSGYAQGLCQRWETAAQQAGELGVRVCPLRLGVVLDDGGGALEQMSMSFRLGIASYMGGGSQWFSWIHRDDVVAAICFLLQRQDLSGPFNLTAPEPVTAKAFAVALRHHFHTLPPMSLPAPVARLLLGEMADELLLNGQRVVPTALLEAGFEFRYPELEQALAAIY